MNNIKHFTFYDFISIVGCIGFIIVLYFLIPPDKYNLYDYLKAKRLESYNKKDTNKIIKSKPTDRQTLISTEVTGNVESIHIWGRTEIVPVTKIELEYFEYCDEWVMDGDIIQPSDRKNYFMPVLRGSLDFNVRDFTQTWIQHNKYESDPIEKAENFEDFRVADIRIKNGKIIDINYFHYRLSSSHTWNIIASWKANFNPDVPDTISEKVQKNNAPIIVCIYCDGTGERLEDTNLIWRDAKMALWLNKHLMNDKCKDCDSKNDKYCGKVDNQHKVFLKEYETLGSKMEKTSCSECMGMGQFSSFDMKTKKYVTQEEYEKRERNKLNKNNNHKK